MGEMIGIFRETQHSPNREFDDYEILRWTAKEIERAGVSVALKKPEEALAGAAFFEGKSDFFFVMCEREEILARLGRAEQNGASVVNSVRGIYSTYRFRMTPLLQENAVAMPKSLLVYTEGSAREVESFLQTVA